MYLFDKAFVFCFKAQPSSEHSTEALPTKTRDNCVQLQKHAKAKPNVSENEKRHSVAM